MSVARCDLCRFHRGFASLNRWSIEEYGKKENLKCQYVYQYLRSMTVLHAARNCFRHCLCRQNKVPFCFLLFTLHVLAYSNQADITQVRGKAAGIGSDLTLQKRVVQRTYQNTFISWVCQRILRSPKWCLNKPLEKKNTFLSGNFKTLQFACRRDIILNVGSIQY